MHICWPYINTLFMYTDNSVCSSNRVRLAEWSKAPDLSSGTRKRAWVRTPHLTIPIFFVYIFFHHIICCNWPWQHFRTPPDSFERPDPDECSCAVRDRPYLCILEVQYQEELLHRSIKLICVFVENEANFHAISKN